QPGQSGHSHIQFTAVWHGHGCDLSQGTDHTLDCRWHVAVPGRSLGRDL
ncbi:uncharacterized protein METZ01_LOCUS389325, partial [marine metagenome]